MKLQQSSQTQNTPEAMAPISTNSLPQRSKQPAAKPLTFGQKLADKLASKVGSWPFLIGQSTVLAAWVGCNLTPGLPHWDESPFILLNLVFSFASAYTAPVVLMSQNRQSDEDREHAMLNHQVNLETAANLQLLHEKMDELYSQKLAALTELIQQQQALNATPSPTDPPEIRPQLYIPNYIGLVPSQIAQTKPEELAPIADNPLFNHYQATPAANSVEPKTLPRHSGERD